MSTRSPRECPVRCGEGYSVPVPRFANQLAQLFGMNSGPLSDRICSGIPRHNITSDNVNDLLAAHPPIHPDRQIPACTHRARSAAAAFSPRAFWHMKSCATRGSALRPQSTQEPSATAVLAAYFQPSRRQIRCTRPCPLPSPHSEQRCDCGSHIVLQSQGNDRSGQSILVHPMNRLVSLCPSPLPQQVGRHAVPTTRVAPTHAPPHNAAAQGSEVSLCHIPQRFELSSAQPLRRGPSPTPSAVLPAPPARRTSETGFWVWIPALCRLGAQSSRSPSALRSGSTATICSGL